MAQIYAIFRKQNAKQDMESFYNGWWAERLYSEEFEKKLERIAGALIKQTVLTIRLNKLKDYTIYCYSVSKNRFALLVTDKLFDNAEMAKGLLFNLFEPHLTLKAIAKDPEKYFKTKLTAVQDKLKAVKEIMIDNLQLMAEQSDKLNTILEKSEELEQMAALFKASAKKMNQHWCVRLFCIEKPIAWFNEAPQTPSANKLPTKPLNHLKPQVSFSSKLNSPIYDEKEEDIFFDDEDLPTATCRESLLSNLCCCLKYPSMRIFLMGLIVITAIVLIIYLPPLISIGSFGLTL